MKTQKGFTLIELMIVLIILIMISSLVVGIISDQKRPNTTEIYKQQKSSTSINVKDQELYKIVDEFSDKFYCEVDEDEKTEFVEKIKVIIKTMELYN